MCNDHTFRFNEDKAYKDQLVSVLEASAEHPLSAPGAPRQPGIFVLFHSSVPVHVGKTKDLQSRLKDHLIRTANRKEVDVSDVTCRFLTIERRWEVLRAKAVLTQHYLPE